MTSQEIIELDNMVSEKLDTDPESAFDFFKERWKKLSVDEKNLFSNYRGKFNPLVSYSPLIPDSQESRNYEIKSAYRSQICAFINKDLSGKTEIVPLKCGEGIKPVDISCVFKLLHDLKYLDNTLLEIEEVLVQSFNFNRATIKSYLNDSGKLKKSARDFKKLVDKATMTQP